MIKYISRREFIDTSCKLATLFGVSSTLGSLINGCASLGRIIPKEDPKTSKDLETLLNKIELFKELNKNPNISLKIIEDNSIYKRGHLAEYMPNINLFDYSGTIKITPYSSLSDEDKESFESSIYHELVHVEQDYEIYNYYFQNGSNIPEWKIKFYYANLPKEEKIHIGCELDAHYKQALFEKRQTGKINKSTLAGFFTYYMQIQRTTAFNTFNEIRQLVSDEYDKIKEISGYDLESFLSKSKK